MSWPAVHPLHPRPVWPGYSARGTLVLPLPSCWLDMLPPLLEVEGVVLGRKSEAHLTLLDATAAARVRACCPEGSVRALFEAAPWGVAPTGERWLLGKRLPSGRTAHSVIELVDAPGLAAFRAGLGEAVGSVLPEPVPHVTLYVAGKTTGIGVPDVAAFHRLRLHRLPVAPGIQSP